MRPAFLALLLAACASPEHTVRAADTRLAQATLTAALAWDEALLLGPCPEVRLIPVGYHATADIVVVAGHDPDGRRAVTFHRASTILVDIETVEERGSLADLPAVIGHELGHELGIPEEEHSARAEDLMHNTFPPGRDAAPTGFDVAWVCDQW